MTEQDIQRGILKYLELKGIFHYRNNSGAFKNSKGKFYRFGAQGSPDIVCVINGQYVGIEVKRPSGIQSDFQKEFEKNLVGAGGAYFLVDSLEKTVKIINEITNYHVPLQKLPRRS